MTDASADVETPTGRRSVFSRVLVGVDGTEPSFEACRQAALLAEPGTPVDAVAVVHLGEASMAGPAAPHVADEMEREAEAAIAKAAAILGERARTHLVNGFVTAALLREIERSDATLVALGSHGHRRLTEILIGGVAGELLHTAPCSVLVARPATGPDTARGPIVVGVDGSEGAAEALAAAARLAARLGSGLRVVTAPHGRATDELVAASHAARLVVVGSRGLHGLRALGSVSERVAHRAACSVLVVRPERRR